MATAGPSPGGTTMGPSLAERSDTIGNHCPPLGGRASTRQCNLRDRYRPRGCAQGCVTRGTIGSAIDWWCTKAVKNAYCFRGGPRGHAGVVPDSGDPAPARASRGRSVAPAATVHTGQSCPHPALPLARALRRIAMTFCRCRTTRTLGQGPDHRPRRMATAPRSRAPHGHSRNAAPPRGAGASPNDSAQLPLAHGRQTPACRALLPANRQSKSPRSPTIFSTTRLKSSPE